MDIFKVRINTVKSGNNPILGYKYDDAYFTCLQQRFILQNRQFKCPHVTWTLTKTSFLFFFQILLFTVRINTVKRLNLQNYDNCKELFLSKFSVANFL